MALAPRLDRLPVIVRRTLYGLAIASVLLGLGHTALTLPMYRQLTLPALWFAGSGLAMVVCGLMNLLALRARSTDGLARWLPVFSNACLTAFGLLLWPLLPAPQVAVAIALFAGSTACSLALLAKRA